MYMVQLAKNVPIVGSFEEFVRDPLALLVKARDVGEVVKLVSPDIEYPYLVSNPDMIHEVLITKHDSFTKSKNLQVLKLWVGEGILTSEGERHRKDRQVMQPFFNMKHISAYAPTMVKFAEKMLARWQDGDIRDITKEMMDVTLEIITDTMFGTSVIDKHENGLRELIDEGHRLITEKIRMEGHEPPEETQKRNLALQQGLERLNQIIYAIIEERRNQPENKRHDLLSSLLRTGMTDKQLRDQVITIFLAGHETTANTLAWTWYLLSQHPEVEAKFHEELRRVLNGHAPTYESLKELTYTRMIIQESMRLYPAAWSIGRIAKEDVVIGEYEFKKGEWFMMSQYAVHRDPKWYKNPDEFIPERFEGDFLKTIPTYAYFPFGGGPRVCIGNNFAFMEATLLLATIGQQFKLDLTEGAVVEPEPLITLVPKGLQMRVRKR
jgi:cytochrome P450